MFFFVLLCFVFKSRKKEKTPLKRSNSIIAGPYKITRLHTPHPPEDLSTSESQSFAVVFLPLTPRRPDWGRTQTLLTAQVWSTLPEEHFCVRLFEPRGARRSRASLARTSGLSQTSGPPQCPSLTARQPSSQSPSLPRL